LGSGAGNDCFVVRSLAGENGKVIGLDFTDEMLEKARLNTKKLNYSNIEFVKGDIENMPLNNEIADVIVSNCVLNLVPDKQKAFAEIYRVLKHSGHFCISDVVLKGNLPEAIKTDIIMYVGCVSGAILKEEYIDIISNSDFKNIQVKKEKKIEIPDFILKNYLTEEEVINYHLGSFGIYSITVFAEK